jgi:hypothetical protein
MEDQTVNDYLQHGGKVTHLRDGDHSQAYIDSHQDKQSPPTTTNQQEPSAKSCRNCNNYNRGAGSKPCLRCKNYKLMDAEDIRTSMHIIPVVSGLIEAFPAPTRPDNDLMSIIRQLSSHNAAMLCMCYYGGLSVREMSDVLGISQEATWKKLYRSVSNLRKIIADKYPEVKSTKQAKLSNLLSPNKYTRAHVSFEERSDEPGRAVTSEAVAERIRTNTTR